MNHVSDVRASLGSTKKYHFTTGLDVRQPRHDERDARRSSRFALRYSCWHPTTMTKGLRGELQKICVLPPFWVSDDHETTRRWSPPLACEPTADRKNNVLKRRWPFEEQPSSAAFIFISLQEQLSLAISKEQLSSAAFQEQLSSTAFQ